MAKLAVKTARGLNPQTAIEIISSADRDSGGGMKLDDQIELMAYAARYKLMLNRQDWERVVAHYVKGRYDLDKPPSDYPFWQGRTDER